MCTRIEHVALKLPHCLRQLRLFGMSAVFASNANKSMAEVSSQSTGDSVGLFIHSFIHIRLMSHDRTHSIQ